MGWTDLTALGDPPDDDSTRVSDPPSLLLLASGMVWSVQSELDERSWYANRDTDNLAPGSRRSTV